MNTPQRRGPKIKPAELHTKPKHFRLAPDVVKLLETVPKGKQTETVNEAIRLLFKNRARKKTKGHTDYAKGKHKTQD